MDSQLLRGINKLSGDRNKTALRFRGQALSYSRKNSQQEQAATTKLGSHETVHAITTLQNKHPFSTPIRSRNDLLKMNRFSLWFPSGLIVSAVQTQ